MLNQADPLNTLRDIHMPPPISWWPLAPGWWIASVIVIVLAAFLIAYWVRRSRRARAKKAALAELMQLKAQYQHTKNGSVVADISLLLRRAALAYFPRSRVASLHSYTWLQFLDSCGNTHAFTQGTGRLLLHASYKPTEKLTASPQQINELFLLAKQWCLKALL